MSVSPNQRQALARDAKKSSVGQSPHKAAKSSGKKSRSQAVSDENENSMPVSAFGGQAALSIKEKSQNEVSVSQSLAPKPRQLFGDATAATTNVNA